MVSNAKAPMEITLYFNFSFFSNLEVKFYGKPIDLVIGIPSISIPTPPGFTPDTCSGSKGAFCKRRIS